MEISDVRQKLERERSRLLFLAAVKAKAGRSPAPTFYTWTEHRGSEIRMCGGWSAPPPTLGFLEGRKFADWTRGPYQAVRF